MYHLLMFSATEVCNEKRYKFLSDFVPLRVTAGDALKAVVERS
uniref:Uncharacterized protein n=1 Tax=Aegilops tauschii subsp. strangulata TaxID=200361 RepID=A0A453MLV6_AEGTS